MNDRTNAGTPIATLLTNVEQPEQAQPQPVVPKLEPSPPMSQQQVPNTVQIGTPLPPDVMAALAAQVNVKQGAKRISKARQTALQLRNLHWPNVNIDDLWLLTDGQRGGFAQVPRTLSMIMNMINDIAKRKTGKSIPAGKTYLILWLHVYEEGLVRIGSEEEAAFEGKRPPSTVLSTESEREMMLATTLGSGVQPASLAAQFQGRKSSTRLTG